jgi:hypothetical protein
MQKRLEQAREGSHLQSDGDSATADRLLPCSTPWCGSRPSGMSRARGGEVRCG